MKKNWNLLCALSLFSVEWEMDKDFNLGSLSRHIESDLIHLKLLKGEYIDAIENENFDWINLANECKLFSNIESYTNKEIKNYIKYLLHDYLFPEKVLKKTDIEELITGIENILSLHTENNGWVNSYVLYDELIMQEKYKNLEYYNLWNIPCFFTNNRFDEKNRFFSEKGYWTINGEYEISSIRIERMPYKDKYGEIGYFRFV